MLILTELRAAKHDVCEAIARLKQNPATQHVPVIAFGDEETPDLQKTALAAGVTLIVSEAALLNHLAECLDQALSID
jgi:CheY-like chemotaxis protein